MPDFSEADDTGGAPSPQLEAAAAAKRAAVAANAPKAQLSWMDQVGRFFWNPDGELEKTLTALPGAVADLGVRGAGYTAEGLYRTLPGATEKTAKDVGAATRELVGGELERRQGVVPEPGAQFGSFMHEEPVKPTEAPAIPEKPAEKLVTPSAQDTVRFSKPARHVEIDPTEITPPVADVRFKDFHFTEQHPHIEEVSHPDDPFGPTYTSEPTAADMRAQDRHELQSIQKSIDYGQQQAATARSKGHEEEAQGWDKFIAKNQERANYIKKELSFRESRGGTTIDAAPGPLADPLKPALAEADQSMRTMQEGADPNAPASVQNAGMAQHFSPQQAEARAAVEKMNRVGKPFGPPPGAPPRQPPGGPPHPPAAGMPPGGPPGGSRAFPGQRTFAPASLSPTTPYYGSRNVVAELAQERLGTADRITLQETNKLEEFRRPFNALHDGYGSDPNPPGTNAPTKADIVRRVQRVIKTPLADPVLERGAQAIRDSNKGVERRFMNRPAYQHLNWIEDYFTGLWKATPERQAFLDAQRGKYGPGGKLGTGRFLKEKKLPTIDDALKAGLEPLYNDLLDTVAHYQQSMNRHLAMGEIYDTLKDNGAIKWFFKEDPKAAGYAPMERGGPHNERQFIENDAGMRPHLPEDAARVWNNMVSLPWEAYHPRLGPYLEFIRRGQNLLTQATLAVPVYHALNETMTAVSNEFGRAIDNTLFAALKGETPQWKMGVKDMVYALGAPIHLAWTGKKLNTELARATDTSTRIGKIADLYARTRPNILNETVPWGSTGAGQNWWLPLQRGAVGNQLRGYKRELQDAARSKILNFRRSPEGTWQLSPAANKALPVIGKVIGRTVDSVTHLFWSKWIPSLKRGAFYNAMNAFIERNPHATQAELDQAARAHAASMDDRFGQMQTDNLFWSKRLQDAMHLSFLSADWNTSFLRGFGGAASDVRKLITSGADVKHLSTRVSYIIGWGLATALAGGVTTYMLTGRGPQSLKDLFYPPNGLKNEDGSEARIQLPGHLKDVTEAARVIRDPSRANIERLATGKVSPFAWLAYQTFMGTDWRGFRTNPTNETMSLIGRFFENVLSHVTPIPLQQAGQERKGQLGGAATMLGIRPAPFDVQEPEKAALQEVNSRFHDAVNKLRADTRYQQSLQNPKSYDSTIARDNRDVKTLAQQLQDAQDALSKSQRKNGYQGTVAPQQ